MPLMPAPRGIGWAARRDDGEGQRIGVLGGRAHDHRRARGGHRAHRARIAPHRRARRQIDEAVGVDVAARARREYVGTVARVVAVDQSGARDLDVHIGPDRIRKERVAGDDHFDHPFGAVGTPARDDLEALVRVDGRIVRPDLLVVIVLDAHVVAVARRRSLMKAIGLALHADDTAEPAQGPAGAAAGELVVETVGVGDDQGQRVLDPPLGEGERLVAVQVVGRDLQSDVGALQTDRAERQDHHDDDERREQGKATLVGAARPPHLRTTRHCALGCWTPASAPARHRTSDPRARCAPSSARRTPPRQPPW